MRLGMNYPRGPMAWAEAIGADHVLLVLDALRSELGEERYRTLRCCGGWRRHDRPVCIDHLTLPVADLAASHAFYAAALGALGWEEIEVEGFPAWGPPDAEDFSIEPGTPPPSGMHIAFAVDSHEAVEAFHAAAVAAGGRDNGGRASARTTTPATTRPSCWIGHRDGGNNVEAVFHGR